MDQASDFLELHWHTYLLRHPDDWLVVKDITERTGLSEDEVLFFLLDAWAAQNLTLEQRHEFDQVICPRSGETD